MSVIDYWSKDKYEKNNCPFQGKKKITFPGESHRWNNSTGELKGEGWGRAKKDNEKVRVKTCENERRKIVKRKGDNEKKHMCT